MTDDTRRAFLKLPFAGALLPLVESSTVAATPAPATPARRPSPPAARARAS
jgi:hypothetical protein